VLRLIRVVETSETLGLPDTAGSAFPPHVDSLLVLKGRSLAGTVQLMAGEDGAVRLQSAKVSDAINISLDADGGVMLLDAKTRKLSVLSRSGSSKALSLASLKLKKPRGLTVDPATGTLYVLDGRRRIVIVEPGPGRSYDARAALRDGRVSERPLPEAWVDVRGIAFDPETGHLHLYSPQTRELFELDGEGRAEAVRELPDEQGDPRAMVFASSSDATDPPERTSLFLVTRGAVRPEVTEWTLHPAPTPPQVVTEKPSLVPFRLQAAASPAAAGDPTLVRNIHAWQFDPPSPDSAGIAYVPGSGSLLMSDSEVNEMNIYEGVNMFELTLSGSLFDTWDTTDYSGEPTGVAYNPSNGHAFISDDSAKGVWIVDPRSGGQFGDGNDHVSFLDTDAFGSSDPEGVTYNTANGRLYIVDGVNRQVYEVRPGNNGTFGDSDDSVSDFDTSSLGVEDPEGITFDSSNGHLYIVGKPESEVREITTSGTLVRVLDTSAANPDKPAGLAYGPTSVNSSQASIYLVARGVDNGKDSNENDGEIYEFTLGDFNPGPSNDPPTVVARPDDTVALGETVPLTSTISDDGNPDPPGTITSISWVQDDGPAQAQIDNPNVEDTTVSFPAMGSYVLRVTASDGELTGSDSVGFTVTGAGGEVPVEIRVSARSDDAEQRAAGGVSTSSGDLEMTLDKSGNQLVGLRFTGAPIPQFATIDTAWIQFQADETSSMQTDLVIAGEDVGDAPTFLSASNDISARTRTSETASWSPAAWTSKGDAGPAQRTPDISNVIQEIVDRDDWSAGNDLAIIISGPGNGKRVAESYDGTADGAALLHVEYSTGGGPRNLAPVVNAGADQALEVGESASLSGSASDDDLPDPPGAIQSTTWSQLNGPPFADIASPSSLSTTATFPGEGSYLLRLSAYDGEKEGTDDLTVTVSAATPPPPPPGADTAEVRISVSEDDAEQRGDQSMKLGSGDLEMTQEKRGPQIVGLRFDPLDVPAGARIDNAWIQFKADESSSGPSSLSIGAEASANAAPFAGDDGELALRPTTGAFVGWSPPDWVQGQQGPGQQTPNLATVIDSVVNGGGWQSGNALLILISGSGDRVAESFDGDAAAAPLLHVEYTVE
jgi:uncharacterized protein YjiK